MPSAPVEGPFETFRPTSGQVIGWIGLALVAVVLVLGLLEGADRPVIAGALAFAALDWAAMLRPRVLVRGRWLVLRNMLETIHLPLAGIEDLAVRQVLAVRVGEKRYVSPALGRSFRQTVRSGRAQVTDRSTQAYPDFVEERLRHLIDEARAREGVARYSAEQQALAAQVRREPAWLPIGLLALTLLAFAGTLLLL